MAITPWSWTKSNGSASAAQTVAAYNAITSKGYTYSFSRKVWNDLVSKINETAVALGRGWSNEILSLSETKMYWLYSSLSAKMFNSARLNTNYRVWSWSTDETQPGYIGRDDFNGVDDVGEKDADFVYGRYFLELTERLNLVIDLVNGGGQRVELKETIGTLVAIASKLTAFATEHSRQSSPFPSRTQRQWKPKSKAPGFFTSRWTHLPLTQRLKSATMISVKQVCISLPQSCGNRGPVHPHRWWFVFISPKNSRPTSPSTQANRCLWIMWTLRPSKQTSRKKLRNR